MAAFTGEPRLEQIADGVHTFLQPDGGWCLNNAGLLDGDGRPVLVDTAATEARARLLRSLAVKAVGVAPSVIVNTHSHGDHTFGNFVFPEALVVGHERTRREAEKAGLHLTGLWPRVDWGEVELVLPHLTFTGPVTMRLGGDDVELHSYGPAHSGCDTVVWLPRQRVLFTGDLVMSGVTPFVLTGSVGGLRSAVARLREFGAATVVPGHGPVGGPELLDATERYLDWLTELARAGLAAGLPPLRAAHEADLGEFAELLDGERLATNLHRAYDEFRGGTHDAPADVDQLFAELVELHGGTPECHA
jgi:cyclase